MCILDFEESRSPFMMRGAILCLLAVSLLPQGATYSQTPGFVLNAREYFEHEGVSVIVFQDFYPEGHQSGVTLIQHGERVAANGDLRLEATPGQRQPVPRLPLLNQLLNTSAR